MPQFEHGGASLHYEIVGEGAPLLLIAGLASDHASWGPLPARLGGRQLIMIDNRGSGQSRFEGAIRVHDMADDCAALLAELGLGAVDVVGHSLGGAIALRLAATHPGRVRRLVTLATGPLDAKGRLLFRDMAQVYFTMVPTDWFRLLFQWLFAPPFFASEASVAAAALASANYRFRQSPGDFARQVAALDGPIDLDLAAITCPVLALAGELDLLAPPAVVAALHEALAAARLAVITGAAHSLHWEKPDEVAAAIEEFLG